jgi:hypothetical protein
MERRRGQGTAAAPTTSGRGVLLRADGWSGDGVGELLLLPQRRADEESSCAPTDGAKTGSGSCCCPNNEQTRSLAAHRRMEQRRGLRSCCCPEDERLHGLMLLSQRWQRKARRRQGTTYSTSARWSGGFSRSDSMGAAAGYSELHFHKHSLHMVFSFGNLKHLHTKKDYLTADMIQWRLQYSYITRWITTNGKMDERVL